MTRVELCPDCRDPVVPLTDQGWQGLQKLWPDKAGLSPKVWRRCNTCLTYRMSWLLEEVGGGT